MDKAVKDSGPAAERKDDLASKYLTPSEAEESRTGKEAGAAGQGLLALAGAAACFVLGFIVTQNSRETIYYGLFWVGGSTALEGLYCLATGTGYARIPKAWRVVFWIIGLIVGIVVACAAMKH